MATQEISTLFASGLTPDEKVRKATFDIMQHPVTAGYAGVMMLGESRMVDDPAIRTACTDGRNKMFNRDFIRSLSNMRQVRFLRLHEDGHVLFMHPMRLKQQFRDDPKLANAAADYAVNGWIIDDINQPEFFEMPKGGLYDPKFKGWSAEEIYRFLKEGKEKDKPNDRRPPPQPPEGQGEPCDDGESGEPQPGEPGGAPKQAEDKVTIDGKDYPTQTMDDHLPQDSLSAKPSEQDQGPDGIQSDKELSADEQAELEAQQAQAEAAAEQAMADAVAEALRQGSILAGRMGSPMPRSVDQLLAPEIDWKDATQDFVTASCSGKDEYTWRRFDRKRFATGLIAPDVESETAEEIVICGDCSGSISQAQISTFADWMAQLIEQVNPRRVRVIWWHTEVSNEQVFEENDFANFKHLLKPNGSGGTRAGCAGDYLVAHGYQPDCIIVFTDGHVENPVLWKPTQPTLWLVTENSSFAPPRGGRMVKFNPRTQA